MANMVSMVVMLNDLMNELILLKQGQHRYHLVLPMMGRDMRLQAGYDFTRRFDIGQATLTEQLFGFIDEPDWLVLVEGLLALKWTSRCINE